MMVFVDWLVGSKSSALELLPSSAQGKHGVNRYRSADEAARRIEFPSSSARTGICVFSAHRKNDEGEMPAKSCRSVLDGG
jgi:hypothetical protein